MVREGRRHVNDRAPSSKPTSRRPQLTWHFSRPRMGVTPYGRTRREEHDGYENAMSAMPGPGPSNAARVAKFLDVLRASTGHFPISANLEARTQEIDQRIAGA